MNQITLATMHAVRMFSGVTGYTVRYFVTVNGKEVFWHYTTTSKSEAEKDVELLNAYIQNLKPPKLPGGRIHREGGIMNTYIAFYKGKRIEVTAETSYKAQLEAARVLKAKKSYDVTVVLAEKDGGQVTHVADF